MPPNVQGTILIVDDQAPSRYARSRVLRRAGYNVVEAATGREALELAAVNRPDLVILDVNLPDIHGFEVCRRLKIDATVPVLPVVHMSASHVTAPEQVRGLEGGADAYLVEPVAPEVLTATVGAFLRARRAEMQAQELIAKEHERLEQLVRQRTDELRRSHTQLRASERLAALGTLSAGLGHDMGNLLLPLRIRLELLRSMDLPAAAQAELDSIGETCEYLTRLSSGLRLLAVDSAANANSEVTNLQEWWNDVAPLLRSVLPRQVELRYEFSPDARSVQMSKTGLTQAIFNLVQNAGDVMQTGPVGWVKLSVRAEGDKVVIVVADSGPGMSEETLKRCLEPFYTTKQRAMSTGLGLALVYGLVTEAGGVLRVESKLGQGSTFTLTLPAGEPPRGAAGDEKGLGCMIELDLRDERLRALFRSEATRLGCQVRTEPGKARACDVRVTDRADKVGPQPERIIFVGPSEVAPRHAKVVSERPRLAEIRECLVAQLAASPRHREDVTG